MKIINLKAENIKNLKAIEINPNGEIITLTGKNGAGKSAVLDSIFTTLTGQRIDDAIRHGEDKASVEIDMGDFIVKKTWTPKGEYLRIEGLPKGRTPQAFLNEIIGKLSFDPLEFSKLKGKEQMTILKELVGLDFSDLDKLEQEVYEERATLNSKIKGLIAQLKNAVAPDPSIPDEEMTFKDELEKLNQLRDKKQAFEDANENVLLLKQKVKDCANDIECWRAEIQKIEAQIHGAEEQKSDYQNQIEKIIIPPEVTEAQITAVQSALEDIEKKNADIREAKRYRSLVKESNSLQKDADLLTQRLERTQQDKSTRIANAKFPLEGLSITDESVSFNGILFDRLSTGQQIKASTAIAMKLNPTARIIFIREGSLLDAAGLQAIAELAKDNDYQVWIEKVDDSGTIGIHIEDGAITSINGEKKDEPQTECITNVKP